MTVLFANQNHDPEVAARVQRERRNAPLEELRQDPTLLTQLGLDPKRLPPVDPPAN